MRAFLLCLLLVVGAWAQDDVIVAGNPPLTKAWAKNMHDFFSWSLRAPLTQQYSDQLQATLVSLWQKNQYAGLEPLFNQLDNLDMMPSAARQELRDNFRAELLTVGGPLGDLAQQVDADARKVVVAGDPPLTRLAVEAFSEWYLFALGNTGPAPGNIFNDSMAVTLGALYPTLTPEQRQNLANVPASWAALRKSWPTMAAADQDKLRAQWQTLLAPMLVRRQPLRPAFAAMDTLRKATLTGDSQTITTAAAAVTQQAISLRALGTPEAVALAGRLEALVSQDDAYAQIDAMSSEIADRTHLPLSDPDSIRPVLSGGFYNGWANSAGLPYRW